MVLNFTTRPILELYVYLVQKGQAPDNTSQIYTTHVQLLYIPVLLSRRIFEYKKTIKEQATANYLAYVSTSYSGLPQG